MIKINNKSFFVILFVSLFLLFTGYTLVVSAQTATSTPTPIGQSTPDGTGAPNNTPGTGTTPTDGTVTPDVGKIRTSIAGTPTPTGSSGSSNSTPEAFIAVMLITPTVEPTPTSTGGLSIDLSNFTLETLIKDLIVIAIVIILAILGSRLIYLVLRRFVKRSGSEFDDQLLETLRPQISWLLAAMGFQIITNRSSFISGNIFEVIYFLLYWFVGVATIWRTIDFASKWYIDHLTEEDQKLPESMVPLLKRISQIIVFIIACAVLLGYFGVNILAIFAALGLGGFAIALAAQDTISNIISGFVIMMDQPFKIGDRIYVSSVDGWADVDEIGVRSTTVITRDNRQVEIPNSLIVDQPVINYSRPDPSYRLQTDIGIGTGMDIPKVVQILRDAVQEVDGVMKDKGVDVLFIDFGDSSNTFRVRWWVASYTGKRGVSHAVNTAIQEAATKEGIDMPDTTIALDNRLRFSDDDIDKITKSFQTSPTPEPPASPEVASGEGEED